MSFRIGVFALVIGLELPLPCAALAEPLPEGDSGIAARYPGDVGIGADPAVIFADDFESYGSAADLTSKWSKINHSGNMRIASDPGNIFGGGKALEVAVPRQSGEVSINAIRNVDPKRDVLFLRYYAKYDTGFDVLGSSHNGGTISADYCCPGIRADGHNKFFVSYEAWRGETSTVNPGSLNVYVYHPAQRDVWGDHFFPTGRILPFDRTPGDFGPEFRARPEVVPSLGRWHCFEMMVKANAVGQRDGRIALWLDGKLIADFPNLSLRETAALKIDQFTIDLHVRDNRLGVARKWYDNVVAATSYIGPVAQPKPVAALPTR